MDAKERQQGLRETVQRHLTSDSREKIYRLLSFTSLALLFIGAWQVRPVIVGPQDPLGLASHLTPYYWIGLALIVLVSIFAFLDRDLKKDATFIIILVSLGLFLFGITVFVLENAAEPDAYYHFSGVNVLLAQHHLDISHPTGGFLGTYDSWPAYVFLSAAISETTGVGFAAVSYVPLFWLLFFVLVTYVIGKRLRLAPNRCFALSFLALTSSWVAINEYTPRLLGDMLLLQLLMLLLVPRRTAGNTLTTALIFSALVLTHGVTALAALIGIILVSAYRREYKFVPLFIIIFGAWYIYQAYAVIEVGIEAFFSGPLSNVLQLSQQVSYGGTIAIGRIVARYSQLTFLTIFAALIIGSAVQLLRRRITGPLRKKVISLFGWTIGVASTIFLAYGQEAIRALIFILVPVVCIVALSFSSRKLLIPLMCIFVVLFPLAKYTTTASFGQVLTPELKGSEFFALNVGSQDPYFSDYAAVASLVPYYDRTLITVPSWFPERLIQLPGNVDFSFLDGLHYVILSKQGSDGLIFAWGEDPYSVWPQTEVGQRADLGYNSGYFQIYENYISKGG